MNKFLACFLLIAVLASAQCSIWDSIKGWVKKGVEKVAETVSNVANNFVEKNPMFKNIYKELIHLGENAAFKMCCSFNYGEIYCLDLIKDAKRKYVKI